MGMSTHVIGFRELDAEHKKKVAAFKACRAAGVAPPRVLSEYFGDLRDIDDLSGLEVELDDSCAKEYSEDSQDGYEIIIARLPKGVTRVRVYNSY